MVSGLSLRESRGRLLAIGDVRLHVRGETRPCERMDEAVPGLRRAMERDWRGGVFAQVLVGGTVHVGDEACWCDASSAPESAPASG